jgi:hypothetical protein
VAQPKQLPEPFWCAAFEESSGGIPKDHPRLVTVMTDKTPYKPENMNLPKPTFAARLFQFLRNSELRQSR